MAVAVLSHLLSDAIGDDLFARLARAWRVLIVGVVAEESVTFFEEFPGPHRCAVRPGARLVQVVAQDLGERLGWRGFDMVFDSIWRIRSRVTPYTLTDLVEGARLAVGEAEPQPDHAGFALGQRLEHRLQLIPAAA